MQGRHLGRAHPLEFLAKLAKVEQTAERVAQKLHIEVGKFIYQQIWRGVNVERRADTAAEMDGIRASTSRGCAGGNSLGNSW
jgi:hypothetical protein